MKHSALLLFPCLPTAGAGDSASGGRAPYQPPQDVASNNSHPGTTLLRGHPSLSPLHSDTAMAESSPLQHADSVGGPALRLVQQHRLAQQQPPHPQQPLQQPSQQPQQQPLVFNSAPQPAGMAALAPTPFMSAAPGAAGTAPPIAAPAVAATLSPAASLVPQIRPFYSAAAAPPAVPIANMAPLRALGSGGLGSGGLSLLQVRPSCLCALLLLLLLLACCMARLHAAQPLRSTWLRVGTASLKTDRHAMYPLTVRPFTSTGPSRQALQPPMVRAHCKTRSPP